MKLLLLLVLLIPSCAFCQDELDSVLSCTSIMVGKKASVDGSVMTSHTCDSYYRTWVNQVPARTFSNDTITSVFKGMLHTEFVEDETGLKHLGDIPEASSTYSYLNTAYPCLNEKQLAFGETTIKGRPELRGDKGIFYIEELQRLALQRCTTARDAIKLMGKLIKEYGYVDNSECLTVADKNEVWIFEVCGEGKGHLGGVWAAVRIPDDEVSVSANVSRISTLNLKDPDHYMASDNVFDVAKRMGLWDGKSEFKFWKAYSNGNYVGEPKAYSVREFYILSTLAPDLKLSEDMEELPLSVKPFKKLSAEDIMNFLGSYYEDFPHYYNIKNLKVAKKNSDGSVDSIMSPAANPWMRTEISSMLNGIKDKVVTTNRNIAVPQCSYSTVIQLRGWLPDDIGGVCWFSLDNPAESPRFPIFAGNMFLADKLGICGQHRYRTDAAIWHFRVANKLASARWGDCRKYIEDGIKYYRAKGFDELSFVENKYKTLLETEGRESARNYLSGYSRDFLGAEMTYWDELTKIYWKLFKIGF